MYPSLLSKLVSEQSLMSFSSSVTKVEETIGGSDGIQFPFTKTVPVGPVCVGTKTWSMGDPST